MRTGIARHQAAAPAAGAVGAQFLAGQLSPATAEAYRGDVRDFFGRDPSELTAEDLRAVTVGDVITWRNERMRTRSPQTVARRLSTLRSLFRHAEALGIVAESPVKPELVKSPRVSNESRTAGLTAQQARALVDAVEADSLTARRDRAVLELMLRTGLRRSEVVAANREDLGEERGHTILIVTGKGGRRETVKVPVPAGRAIGGYLAARDDDHPALFISHASNGHSGKRLSAKAVYR